jgi:Tfp pilus assembly protein PilV
MIPAPKPSAPQATAQHGLSLISVLVAILIFGLGMLSIASLYGLAVPAQTANQETVDTAAFGNQFWAILQANPKLVNQIGAPPTTVTYKTASGAPQALQPLLNNIFNNPQTRLPLAQVAITTGNGAQGKVCTVTPTQTACGVTLVITWNSGAPRSQTFTYQLGFSNV